MNGGLIGTGGYRDEKRRVEGVEWNGKEKKGWGQQKRVIGHIGIQKDGEKEKTAPCVERNGGR